MTNSAPKMNNKVERQGSPSANGKRHHNNRTASIKTTTYFSSTGNGGGANNRNNNNNNNNNHPNANNPNTNKPNTNNPNTNSNNNNNIIHNNSNNNNNSNGNSNNTTRNTSGRTSCSPPCQTKNTRYSPLRNTETSPRGSPTSSFYAGAKFSEPPSPACLPKPPSHWTTRLMTSCQQSETCCNISNHLKMILNIQA